MRFLALEANIRKLKQRFMVDGEEELLTSTRHAFAFLIPMLWIVPLTTLGVVAWIASIGMGADMLVTTPLLYAWLLTGVGLAINAFIEWRYNFVVVTTEKIVIVDHTFIVRQVIRPVPLENIQTTDSGSQYLGLGHCGYVNLHLSEVEHGTNKELRLDTLPKPDVIAGVIENARSLKSQRSPADKGTASQAQKVEDIQNKTEVELPSSDATGAPAPPSQPAELPRADQGVQGSEQQQGDAAAITQPTPQAPAVEIAGAEEQQTHDAFNAGADALGEQV